MTRVDGLVNIVEHEVEGMPGVDNLITNLGLLIGEHYKLQSVIAENDRLKAEIKNIKALEQDPRWISVSERLPEDKTYVLTTIKVPNKIAHVRSSWYEGGLFYNDNGDTWKATDKEVIGWMPSPPCYEPQESEE